MPQTRVAIVCDWIIGGGAERVIDQLHQMYPQAPIYTSYCSSDWRQRLDNKVVTGWLQHWPFGPLRKFIGPLRIWWFGRLDLSQYELVFSVTGNGEAKAIKTAGGATHVCYCFTPVHYYWRHYQDYLNRPGFGIFNPLARLGLRLLVGPLRRWDATAAKRPDYFIAISNHIKDDIKQYYGRDSQVIYPPVDTERFKPSKDSARHGFITVGRQTGYKRTDIIVRACSDLNLPLTVIGNGPEHRRLVKMAGPSIKFRSANDQEVAEALAGAEAFLFAAVEDFGITPVEAMAAGTPVIAYGSGGALDFVEPGKTGLLFDEQTPESLAKTLNEFPKYKFNSADIIDGASRFSNASFQENMRNFLSNVTSQTN